MVAFGVSFNVLVVLAYLLVTNYDASLMTAAKVVLGSAWPLYENPLAMMFILWESEPFFTCIWLILLTDSRRRAMRNTELHKG